MKLLFITNICSHYRIGAFEALAREIDVEFFFFADPREWFWESRNPTGVGTFRARKFKGIRLSSRLRFSPGLLAHLLFDDYDTIVKCTNGRVELPLAFLAAKLRRKYFVLWQTMWYHPQSLFHKVSYPFLQFIWKHSDAIVAYGLHGKEFLIREGVPAGKIFIAWQAVDNQRFNRKVSQAERNKMKEVLGISGKRVVLFVGQLVPVKGLEFLVEAVIGLERDDIVLILAGRGPMESRLRELCNDSPTVRFIGYIEQHELPALYSLASVFVLPSISLPHMREAWGLVVNEAMNQGCPVVVTDAVGAGIGGLVQDSETGFVVPERNPEALRNAISSILNDPSLEKRMRKKAIEVVNQWTFERWASGFFDAIEYVTHE